MPSAISSTSPVTIRCAWIHYGYVARADRVLGTRSNTCASAKAAASEVAAQVFGAGRYELHRQPGTRTVFTAVPVRTLSPASPSNPQP